MPQPEPEPEPEPATARPSSSSSEEEDEETWEQRAWSALVDKVTFKENIYDRKRSIYRKYAPQTPFFMRLAGVSKSQKLRVVIPDTVVLGLNNDPGSGGLAQTWLSTGPDGCVRRRDKFDPDKEVAEAFKSHTDDPTEIVAIFKRVRANETKTQTMLLNSEELSEVIYNRQSYGMFAIQKFVRLRKGRAFLARSVWTKEAGGGGYKHFAYFITKKRNYDETGNVEDLLIDLNLFQSATINVLRGSAVEDLDKMTNDVAVYIQRALAVEVDQVVVDFTKGNSERWIMLQIKDFRLKRSEGARANHEIKERMRKDAGEPDFAASHVKFVVPKGKQTTLHKMSARQESKAVSVACRTLSACFSFFCRRSTPLASSLLLPIRTTGEHVVGRRRSRCEGVPPAHGSWVLPGGA